MLMIWFHLSSSYSFILFTIYSQSDDTLFSYSRLDICLILLLSMLLGQNYSDSTIISFNCPIYAKGQSLSHSSSFFYWLMMISQDKQFSCWLQRQAQCSTRRFVRYFFQALCIFKAALFSLKDEYVFKESQIEFFLFFSLIQKDLSSFRSTSSKFTVRSEMIGDRFSIETASELLLNGRRESSSLKKFCQFNSLIVRSSFRVKFTSELGLVRRVVEDFFFRKYFLVDRELQEAGLFDFDLEFSCKNFSYLNVCIIVLNSGGRLFEFCFTLLQVDFLDMVFLLGSTPTIFLSSIDFTKFFNSLLWNVGMRISSVRLKEGTVAKGSLLLALPFYLLQFFFFLNIQTVILSNIGYQIKLKGSNGATVFFIFKDACQFYQRSQHLLQLHIISMTEQQFSSPDNLCRQSLLQIVARGSALLAELQRLHIFIPKIFIEPGRKYQNILYTFDYFKKMDEIEDKIQKQSQLSDLSQNIKNTYLPLLDRFYRLFEGICTYHQALTDFVTEIQTGVFMQYSLENLFTFQEGKQLISEAFYYFGAMLLLMDHLIEGPIRERMIICYYRNKGGENISNIGKVCKLISDTEFRILERRPQNYVKPSNYPEDFFARYPFDKDIIEAIILAIKDDDIYKHMPAYPQAKYRSFALADQGSMLFVLLFFMPDVLQRAKATMREVVDKHFYNMWVIPFYLGYIIDLTEWWKPYKAAKAALSNILDLESIQELSSAFVAKQSECYEKCNQYLTEGVMTDELVIYNLNTMMNCLRDSNVTLRWLILHRKTVNDKLKEIVVSLSNEVGLLRLMLVTSQFQSLLKERIESLLQNKQSLWNDDRGGCSERLQQLSEYFGKSLGKLEADASLREWFGDMSEAVGKIGYSNSTYATRKIQAFVKALEDIEQYPQVSAKIQVKTYLHDTRKDLDHMIKLVNVKPSTLTHIQVISDITWSWIVLKDYTKLMQKEIRKSPSIALLLKNTFMKLSSILNTPMVRLLEAKSPDIASVSEFYSNQLIRIVKDVLQIIPQLVFENLDNIITIFLTSMKNEPNKFDKAELPKYLQPEQRMQMAKLTNQISVFAESILNMESYLIGVIEVNPKQVLEAGIRKQLIKLIANILEKSLRTPAKTPEEFFQKLARLSDKLRSFKLSLEYIQDFIHIHGLKMFYEQFQKLVYAYVDIEKVYLVTKQIGYEQLVYDESIPMPKGEYKDCNTFMGEILNEIIYLTHPNRCTFLLAAYGFFNLQTRKPVLHLKTLYVLAKCVGISGMQGLDYLLSMRIMDKLKGIIKVVTKVCDQEKTKTILQSAYSSLKNIGSFSQRYERILSDLKREFKNLSDYLLNQLTEIGQYILLRDMFCLQLRMLGKIGSPRLQLVLSDLNESLLSDMVRNQFVAQTQDNQEQMINDNLILALASPYFAHMGMLDPMKKVFITSKHIESLPVLLFTTLALQIFNIDYDNSLKCLIRIKTKKSTIEPNYFLVGCSVLLQQFHPSTKLEYFAYIANYIKSTINFIMINKEVSKNPQVVADLFTYIRFLEQFIKYSREPYEKYKQIIDLGLFSSLDRETLKNGYKLM